MHRLTLKPNTAHKIRTTGPRASHRASCRQSPEVRGILNAGRRQSTKRDQDSAPMVPVRPAEEFLQAPIQLQAKQKYSIQGDPFEQQAERVADQIMHRPVSAPGCVGSCGGICPQCASDRTRRSQVTAGKTGGFGNTISPLPVDIPTDGPGQALPSNVRSFMEPRFGYDFGDVRVHTGPAAGDAANAIDARAYTIRHHIVFGHGEYRAGSTGGRRLLAHELTHVIQQQSAAPPGNSVIQRAPKAKAPAKNTAAGGPKLDFEPAKNTPPCACLVFMHHNEPNARLTARWMFEFCRYNLAIVDPQTTDREVHLPAKGKVDPNGLFPRQVAEDCWNDDKPCEDFIRKNAGATKGDVVEEYAQRQFFLAIKHCSNGFSLPVVALHNNVIGDTAKFRAAIDRPKAPLDLTPIAGKTFDDALKPGTKSTEPDTLPFADLQRWMLDKVPEIKQRKGTSLGDKGILTGSLLKGGQTNIFLWCKSKDISRCHPGDPSRPDNVVWVTNNADFDKLRGTKTNVVLQTKVDPAGKSQKDLSSLFVFLEDIIRKHFAALSKRHLALVIPQSTGGDEDGLAVLVDWLEEWAELVDWRKSEPKAQLAVSKLDDRLSLLRYINIETPQRRYDRSVTRAEHRVQGFRDVRATLSPLGLDCCDAKPGKEGKESQVDKVEKALRKGKLPNSGAS